MEERHLASMERWNVIVGALAVGVAVIFGGPMTIAGTAAGAFLSIANFFVVHRIVRAFAKRSETGERPLGPLVAALFIKFGVLALAVWGVARHTHWNIVGFMAGLSVFVISIFVVSTRFMAAGASHEGPANG